MATSKDTKELKILSFDEILAAADITEEVVDMREFGWEGAVKIRALTKAQQQRVRGKAMFRTRSGEEDYDRSKIEMYLLAEGVVEPKMTYASVEKLKAKNAGALDKITTRITIISGLTPDALISQGEVESAEESFR